MASFSTPPSTFSLSDPAAVASLNLRSAQLTASTAAEILALFPTPSCFASPAEHKMLSDGVRSALDALSGSLPHSPLPSPPRRDSRPPPPTPTFPALIYTDYPPLLRVPDLSFTSDPAAASAWFRLRHITEFLSHPPSLVLNQFPYEGCLVRKDLLPLTLRAFSFSTPGDPSTAPSWYLPTFDLSTEFHLLPDGSGADVMGRWVVKPAQGTHSAGGCVVASRGEAAEFLRRKRGEDIKTEYVAQRCVDRPLLVGGRKMDLRFWIFARSFDPNSTEAYLSDFFHARVANKQFDAASADDEVFYTVSTYNETVPEGTRLTPGLLREQLERELGEAFDWDALLAAVRDLASGLVKSAAVAIGDWPSSRAYYGIDVIVEREEGGALMPKLLEVNFQGDWGAPQHAAESNDCTQEFEQWRADLAQALFTDDVLNAKRFIRLCS